MKQLEVYGWNAFFAGQLAAGETLEQVGRVVQEHKEAYLVKAAAGNVWAEISGKMRHEGAVRGDFPAVGDWVVLRGMANDDRRKAKDERRIMHIVRILQRRTILARRLEGKREGGGAAGDEQILAVNVDVAFLGTALGEDFNLRRLERYLALARDAKVRPVVLLTKADLCGEPRAYVEEVRALGGDLDVHVVSVVSGVGMDDVRGHLKAGVTAVILGSSGIGKSTLVNYLAEADVQDMMEVREFDEKGRHCTTFRHLVRTPTGGLIIDTPGLRGLTLGEATDALLGTFGDVEALAGGCRFRDCRHETEPECAVKDAVEKGELPAERLESYLGLRREMEGMARRENRIQERKTKKLEKRVVAREAQRGRRKWDRDRRH